MVAIQVLVSVVVVQFILQYVTAQENCTEAMMTCANGGNISQSDCRTKTEGPYSYDRTTVCTCAEGFRGPGCDFVNNSSTCANQNLTLIEFPSLNESNIFGCHIDSDPHISNLLDHYAQLITNFKDNHVTFGIQSRIKDQDVYSDMVEMFTCSLYDCQQELGMEQSSMFCTIHAGDCIGDISEDWFVSLLNSISIVIVPDQQFGTFNVDLMLQSLYPLPLSLKCFSGRCR